MTKFRSGLGANALGLATLLVAMAAAPAFTQVQVNSPGSSLTINGRTGDGFGGQLVFPIAAADILTIEIAGEPNRPFGLVVGVRDEFGFNFGPPYGNLHVNPFIVLVDGFAGPGTATYNTNAAGSFVTLDQLAYLPVGFRATLQAYVGTVSGPVLSGPIEFIRVPGDPVPSSLVVGQRNPSFSAGNRHGILADVNNDGDLDWIGSAGIFVGDGNFGFSYLAIDPGGVETAVADLVGDSNLDLVVLDEVFNGLKVFAGNGTGNF
ncbi:MAG: hypothetical protein KDB53_21560, partial [Planctomycetes bacterium]|nr:hypothetical protein [Planctomycetota bacterium]